MKREILALLFYSIVFFASAQSSSNILVQKKYKETLFQFAPRVDVAFDKIRLNIYLAGAINADHAYKSLVENRKWYSQLGLDLGLSEKWYVGISNRINGNAGLSRKNIYNYTTRGYIQHRGGIKSLLFLKEFIYEQFNYSNNTQVQIGSNGTSYSRRTAIGRIGLGLGIGRYFNENKFAVFISYKAFVQTDYGDKRNELFKNRLIDYTNARLDLGYLVNKTWYVGIYISRDTYYSYMPASVPYNTNTITPIVGLACNLILHSKRTIDKPLNSFRYFYTY